MEAKLFSSPRGWAKYTLVFSMLTLPFTSIMANPVSSPSSMTQSKSTLHGRIIDAKSGEAIIGASIQIKNNKKVGTITDIKGNYTLSAPTGSVLIISYVGYETLEIPAVAGEQIIKLKENTQTLNDLVVVGYTTQRKESLTGAMVSIKDSKLKDMTTPSVSNLLNGKAPGVYVSPGSGQPGSGAAVVIRGQATLNGNTRPLWVIDGVIVGDDPGQLNPQDVESLTVLKDAASTAIYGSAGANGVVVVTTKSSRAGKIKVAVSVKTGVSTLNNGNLHMMTGS